MLRRRERFRIVQADGEHLKQSGLVISVECQVAAAMGTEGPVSTGAVVNNFRLTGENGYLFGAEGGAW